ncbi:MAG TPA: histidine--tRNA ligase [Candidatus Saccharimonadales bacterium]|nr:histidine--tRNA ligase [Candidatus Saccharimonadales bacterium]
MAKVALNTPKGFRDFLGEEARVRQNVANLLIEIFERFGFEPLTTPALEYAEILKGKYGEEEKLIYEFEDRGGRQVALRYDQTVPLSRVVAQYPNIVKPYKRYQVQNVWRAENPQKGRYREFLQVDLDTVGTLSLLSDAEIINVVITALEELGFEKFTVRINDRDIFNTLTPGVISAIDKLDKIGEEGVISLIKAQSYSDSQAKEILRKVVESTPTEQISNLFDFLEKQKVRPGTYAFDPTLARGLDYYTGVIFEVEIEGYTAGSVGGGGRYDKLIGTLSDSPIPAVGFSFGFDRLIEALSELEIKGLKTNSTQILVTTFSSEFLENSLEVASSLRKEGVPTEIYLDPEMKLDKQLKYADQKKIPYVVLLGPEEIKEKIVTLKKLSDGSQEKLKISQIKTKISSV